MSTLQKITATVLILLLAAALYGLWSIREPATPSPTVTPANTPVIDESTLLTAQRLARLANTPEEQPLAESAVQTANHELDLAFMGALHGIEAHPPQLSPEALKIQDRLNAAEKRLASDTEVLDGLAKKMGAASEAEKPDLQDQLDLVGSQIELEKDEIEEANDDLLAAGGNVHQRIQKAQEEHTAAERNTPAPAAAAPAAALSSLHGMVAQLREWLALHTKRAALKDARHEAATSAAKLTAQRQQISADLASVQQRLSDFNSKSAHRTAPPAPAASTGRPAAAAVLPANPPAAAQSVSSPAPTAAAPADTLLSLTRQVAIDQRRLMVRDQRVSAREKLADIYAKWDGVVANQQRAVLREWLIGAAVVLMAMVLLLFADGWLNRLLGRARVDRRQLATLRSVIGVALQVVAVLLILFMLVGLPGQIGTMLGLAGAGLTVALKDFIVAFIGWFVLMGKNGIRVGDWVEINGVSGEVVELSMFHTVLLETGNWADAGHPTGRRVTFTNSYAIERHYFNFSTSGQWLWDELTVTVPFGRDARAVEDAIQKEVAAATAEGAHQAELEWQRASRGQRGASVSTEPVIAVRPVAGGVEIAARYVTRASERAAVRARLSQKAVQLLAQNPAT
jgi:small-conductance mechanosensitive channel